LDSSNDQNIKIVDLKAEPQFIRQYVELRNTYCDQLLTSMVDLQGTEKWVADSNVEIMCAIDGKRFLGAMVIYLDKGGEVAFFVRTPGKGIGSRLLAAADLVARKKRIDRLWAWTKKENLPAQLAFENAGYQHIKNELKTFCRKTYQGAVYSKKLK
jgi:GNAT superfamily N-acetyltransferase